MRDWPYRAAIFAACAFAPHAADGYAIPMLGGGQITAPMKHADITFDGVNLDVHVDSTVATPILRPLTSPAQFDPAMPWAVLQDKAYNFQYGWNPGGFFVPPAGTGIWIERLATTPDLEVYFVDGPPASLPYEPIFGTAGSPPVWKWSGAMTHNAYAVLNPSKPAYEATYRVYLGDAATGVAVAGYGAAEVTFQFGALLSADFDEDQDVDGDDFLVWQNGFGTMNVATHMQGDANADGDVDGDDFLIWQSQYGAGSRVSLTTAPEPASIGLALVLLAMGASSHRRRVFSSNLRWPGVRVRSYAARPGSS